MSLNKFVTKSTHKLCGREWEIPTLAADGQSLQTQYVAHEYFYFMSIWSLNARTKVRGWLLFLLTQVPVPKMIPLTVLWVWFWTCRDEMHLFFVVIWVKHAISTFLSSLFFILIEVYFAVLKSASSKKNKHYTNLFITAISALVCVRFPVLTERKHTNNRWQIHVFEFVQLGLLFIFCTN